MKMIKFSYHYQPCSYHGEMNSITNLKIARHVKTIIETLADKPWFFWKKNELDYISYLMIKVVDRMTESALAERYFYIFRLCLIFIFFSNVFFFLWLYTLTNSQHKLMPYFFYWWMNSQMQLNVDANCWLRIRTAVFEAFIRKLSEVDSVLEGVFRIRLSFLMMKVQRNSWFFAALKREEVLKLIEDIKLEKIIETLNNDALLFW